MSSTTTKTTIKQGIGRCSCLRASSFKMGDRVKIVFAANHWTTLRVGDTATVRHIGLHENAELLIRRDADGFSYSIPPQHFKHI